MFESKILFRCFWISPAIDDLFLWMVTEREYISMCAKSKVIELYHTIWICQQNFDRKFEPYERPKFWIVESQYSETLKNSNFEFAWFVTKSDLNEDVRSSNFNIFEFRTKQTTFASFVKNIFNLKNDYCVDTWQSSKLYSKIIRLDSTQILHVFEYTREWCSCSTAFKI